MAGLKRPLKMPQRAMQLVEFQILDTTGTPSLERGSTDGTITDLGVGNYRITFTEPFEAGTVPSVQITVKEADCIAHIDKANTDNTKVELFVFEADGVTAEDASLDVWVLGTFAAEEV